jgi:hypothetical protein
VESVCTSEGVEVAVVHDGLCGAQEVNVGDRAG